MAEIFPDIMLRYPVGKMDIPDNVSEISFDGFKKNIKSFPREIRNFLNECTKEMENFKYRPGGWTIRQIIHHLADSHINAFIRLKLALTENEPVVKPYEEQLWADLPDTELNDLSDSLMILEGVHSRWSILLDNISESQKHRKFYHPGIKKTLTIEQLTYIYDWHCRHHYAHLIIASQNFKQNIHL